MRNLIVPAVAIAGLLTFGNPAWAEEAEQTAAAPEQAQVKEDPIVCKLMAPRTGSRLGARKECRPQSEWDRIWRESSEAVTNKQLRGLQSPTPGG